MNRHILVIALLMTIVIPGIVYSGLFSQEIQNNDEESIIESHPQSPQVSVRVDDEIIYLGLEEYIQGVILGEIPKDFETETLKAQAVAARTYTLRSVQRYQKHEDTYVCANPGCCQAFCTAEAYLRQGGSQSYLDRIYSAVMQTAGQVLIYNNQLIDATYFSASGGRTEAAVEVWGTDVPYLQSVESKGEQTTQYINHKLEMTQKVFLECLELPQEYIGNISVTDVIYTDGGGIASITVCDQKFTGNQIRQYLALPSTMFELSVIGEQVIIVSNGNGHRVGMSQYGADAMAAEGKGYVQILEHYYPGTELRQLTAEEIKGVFDKDGNL